MLNLPNVTLIHVNTTDAARGRDFMEFMASLPISFGATEFLDSAALPHVTDYESFNRFMVCDAWTFFRTTHALFVHDDGFPLTLEAWSNEFLEYDYVGAPWYLYGPNGEIRIRENGVVGNGGFCIRSHDFCSLSNIVVRSFMNSHPGVPYAPEDQLLCNGPRWGVEQCFPEIREKLEFYGMKYAPVGVAARFSWELHDNDPEYRGQFGFHGKHTMERLAALKLIS